MFERPVKQSQSQSPEAARQAAAVVSVVFDLYSPDGVTCSLNQRQIGWIAQIFPPPSHLAPLFRVTPFEFMEKLYGS